MAQRGQYLSAMYLSRRQFVKTTTGGLLASAILPMWEDPHALLAGMQGSPALVAVRPGKRPGTYDILLSGTTLVRGVMMVVETEQGRLVSTDPRFDARFESTDGTTVFHCSDSQKELDFGCSFSTAGSSLTFWPLINNAGTAPCRIKNLFPIVATSGDGGGLEFGGSDILILADEWERCTGNCGLRDLSDNTSVLSAWDIHLFERNGGKTLTLSYFDLPNGKLSFSVGRTPGSTPLDLVVRADLSAGRRGLLLPPGQTFSLARLLLAHARGSIHDSLERYAREIAKHNSLPPVESIPTGWVDWYFSFAKTTEDDILKNLDFIATELKDYGLEYVQIDSGWQLGVETSPPPHNVVAGGPWVENAKFRRGMKWFADQIRARGLKPGIWVRPFHFIDGAQERIDHPEWFNSKGQMDLSHPEVRTLIRGLFTKLVAEWGFEYIKYDFVAFDLFGVFGNKAFADVAAQSEPYDQTRTNIEVYRDVLEEIRASVGKKAKILACNSVMPPTLGAADAFRIGDDVGNWERTMSFGVKSTGPRYYTNGVFWANDPDCLLVREPFTMDQARMWGSLIALSGGIVFISENLAALPPERLDIIRKCLPVYANSGDGYRFGRPLDLLRNNPPTLWHLPVRRDFESWDLLGVFNWSEKPDSVDIDLSEAGFAREKELLAYDFWKEKLIGNVRGSMRLELDPYELPGRYLALEARTAPGFVHVASHHAGRSRMQRIALGCPEEHPLGKACGDRRESIHPLPPRLRTIHPHRA